jgi:heterotetrameric sarcosine oxidase gamma subunit
VIDDSVAVMVAPAGDVITLDLWDASDPGHALADIRHIQVEPRRWWLFDAAHRADAVAARIGDAGALTAMGGGLVRATLTGPGWRALLTIGGFFDSEHSGFGPGAVAATIIHHVPVLIAVTGDLGCEVYCAASYAPALVELWANAIGAENVTAAPRLFSAMTDPL